MIINLYFYQKLTSVPWQQDQQIHKYLVLYRTTNQKVLGRLSKLRCLPDSYNEDLVLSRFQTLRALRKELLFFSLTWFAYWYNCATETGANENVKPPMYQFHERQGISLPALSISIFSRTISSKSKVMRKNNCHFVTLIIGQIIGQKILILKNVITETAEFILGVYQQETGQRETVSIVEFLRQVMFHSI